MIRLTFKHKHKHNIKSFITTSRQHLITNQWLITLIAKTQSIQETIYGNIIWHEIKDIGELQIFVYE